MSTVTNNTTTSGLAATTAATTASKTTEASDRFLKLLVTQMQNQDPLNPMDNAQVTSQMAQINTVTGIEKLNTTMANMGTSFSQMQMMQGISMVGHQVLVEGTQLATDEDGVSTGGFEINAGATNVTVEIQTASGSTIDTLQLGAQTEGQHGFTWTAPDGTATSGLKFKVTAKSGSTEITSTPLMTDQVDAVRTKDGGLSLQLRINGDTSYSNVKALS